MSTLVAMVGASTETARRPIAHIVARAAVTDGGRMTRDIQITFDCADPAGLAAFWVEVLGYRPQEPPAGFASWEQALAAMDVPPERHDDAAAVVDPTGSGPRLFFQRVPEGKRAKNRVHLDVRAAPGLEGEARMAALEQEAERLRRPRRHPTTPPRAHSTARRTHRDGRPRGQRVLPRLNRRSVHRTELPRVWWRPGSLGHTRRASASAVASAVGAAHRGPGGRVDQTAWASSVNAADNRGRGAVSVPSS